ncbi:hypothetical protein FACS189427_08810 [Planctomycetales bacterium]|nr:hypothetical protein FACS189427_08810 [Planctomycetales bacterium]
MNYANSPSTLNFPKLTFCLTLAVLLFTATAQADITLSQPNGSYNWQFDFTNADGAKGSETGYLFSELSQTFRLTDADAYFTSFTIDINAIADIWFTNYAGPEVRDLPIPDDFTASIAAELFINGQYVGDLGYATSNSLVFNPNNLIYFGGNDVVTTWDPTGEVSLNKSFDIDLSPFGETNELTLTWTVIYSDFTDIFENAKNPNDYCMSAYWDFDGAFNISYTTEGGSSISPTPEPASMLIFGLGTLAAGAFTVRRRRK